MAKLKAVLDKLDGLDEAQQALYAPGDDGRFYLDVDGIDDHASVKGLKSAFTRVKGDEAKLRKQLAALPEGLTPEEIAELVEKRNKAQEEEAKAAGRWEDLKKQLNEQHTKQLTKAAQQVQQREAYIRKLVLENDAIKALGEAGATKAGIKLLLPHVLNSLDAVPQEEGDAFAMAVVVKGADGKPRISPAGNGAPMALNELVQEMRKSEDFALAFEGTTSGGSGAPTSTTPGSGGVRTLADLRTPGDKAAYIAKHGLEAFNQLLAGQPTTSVFGGPKSA